MKNILNDKKHTPALQRKRKQRYLLILAESVWLLLFLLLRDFLHSILAFIIPAFISLSICLYANKRLSRPRLEPPDDIIFSVVLPFGGGVVLDLAIMVATMYKLIADDVIRDANVAMTLCQVILFILFIVLIWVHNRPDQMQYIVYAIVYFLVVALEWANTVTFNPLSPLGIDLEFSIPYFILPLKEAMLLYIILDVALQAIANKRNGRREGT